MSKTRVKTYDGEQYDDGFPKYNATLREVIAWLQAKLKEIPPEYRDIARCEINSAISYDSSYATIEISYERPTTPEEIKAERVAEEHRRAEALAAAEAQVARLKAGARW